MSRYRRWLSLWNRYLQFNSALLVKQIPPCDVSLRRPLLETDISSLKWHLVNQISSTQSSLRVISSTQGNFPCEKRYLRSRTVFFVKEIQPSQHSFLKKQVFPSSEKWSLYWRNEDDMGILESCIQDGHDYRFTVTIATRTVTKATRSSPIHINKSAEGSRDCTKNPIRNPTATPHSVNSTNLLCFTNSWHFDSGDLF